MGVCVCVFYVFMFEIENLFLIFSCNCIKYLSAINWTFDIVEDMNVMLDTHSIQSFMR